MSILNHYEDPVAKRNLVGVQSLTGQSSPKLWQTMDSLMFQTFADGGASLRDVVTAHHDTEMFKREAMAFGETIALRDGGQDILTLLVPNAVDPDKTFIVCTMSLTKLVLQLSNPMGLPVEETEDLVFGHRPIQEGIADGLPGSPLTTSDVVQNLLGGLLTFKEVGGYPCFEISGDLRPIICAITNKFRQRIAERGDLCRVNAVVATVTNSVSFAQTMAGEGYVHYRRGGFQALLSHAGQSDEFAEPLSNDVNAVEGATAANQPLYNRCLTIEEMVDRPGLADQAENTSMPFRSFDGFQTSAINSDGSLRSTVQSRQFKESAGQLGSRLIAAPNDMEQSVIIINDKEFLPVGQGYTQHGALPTFAHVQTSFIGHDIMVNLRIDNCSRRVINPDPVAASCTELSAPFTSSEWITELQLRLTQLNAAPTTKGESASLAQDSKWVSNWERVSGQAADGNCTHPGLEAFTWATVTPASLPAATGRAWANDKWHANDKLAGFENLGRQDESAISDLVSARVYVIATWGRAIQDNGNTTVVLTTDKTSDQFLTFSDTDLAGFCEEAFVIAPPDNEYSWFLHSIHLSSQDLVANAASGNDTRRYKMFPGQITAQITFLPHSQNDAMTQLTRYYKTTGQLNFFGQRITDTIPSARLYNMLKSDLSRCLPNSFRDLFFDYLQVINGGIIDSTSRTRFNINHKTATTREDIEGVIATAQSFASDADPYRAAILLNQGAYHSGFFGTILQGIGSLVKPLGGALGSVVTGLGSSLFDAILGDSDDESAPANRVLSAVGADDSQRAAARRAAAQVANIGTRRAGEMVQKSFDRTFAATADEQLSIQDKPIDDDEFFAALTTLEEVADTPSPTQTGKEYSSFNAGDGPEPVPPAAEQEELQRTISAPPQLTELQEPVASLSEEETTTIDPPPTTAVVEEGIEQIALEKIVDAFPIATGSPVAAGGCMEKAIELAPSAAALIVKLLDGDSVGLHSHKCVRNGAIKDQKPVGPNVQCRFIDGHVVYRVPVPAQMSPSDFFGEFLKNKEVSGTAELLLQANPVEGPIPSGFLNRSAAKEGLSPQEWIEESLPTLTVTSVWSGLPARILSAQERIENFDYPELGDSRAPGGTPMALRLDTPGSDGSVSCIRIKMPSHKTPAADMGAWVHKMVSEHPEATGLHFSFHSPANTPNLKARQDYLRRPKHLEACDFTEWCDQLQPERYVFVEPNSKRPKKKKQAIPRGNIIDGPVWGMADAGTLSDDDDTVPLARPARPDRRSRGRKPAPPRVPSPEPSSAEEDDDDEDDSDPADTESEDEQAARAPSRIMQSSNPHMMDYPQFSSDIATGMMAVESLPGREHIVNLASPGKKYDSEVKAVRDELQRRIKEAATKKKSKDWKALNLGNAIEPWAIPGILTGTGGGSSAAAKEDIALGSEMTVSNAFDGTSGGGFAGFNPLGANLDNAMIGRCPVVTRTGQVYTAQICVSVGFGIGSLTRYGPAFQVSGTPNISGLYAAETEDSDQNLASINFYCHDSFDQSQTIPDHCCVREFCAAYLARLFGRLRQQNPKDNATLNVFLTPMVEGNLVKKDNFKGTSWHLAGFMAANSWCSSSCLYTGMMGLGPHTPKEFVKYSRPIGEIIELAHAPMGLKLASYLENNYNLVAGHASEAYRNIGFGRGATPCHRAANTNQKGDSAVMLVMPRYNALNFVSALSNVSDAQSRVANQWAAQVATTFADEGGGASFSVTDASAAFCLGMIGVSRVEELFTVAAISVSKPIAYNEDLNFKATQSVGRPIARLMGKVANLAKKQIKDSQPGNSRRKAQEVEQRKLATEIQDDAMKIVSKLEGSLTAHVQLSDTQAMYDKVIQEQVENLQSQTSWLIGGKKLKMCFERNISSTDTDLHVLHPRVLKYLFVYFLQRYAKEGGETLFKTDALMATAFNIATASITDVKSFEVALDDFAATTSSPELLKHLTMMRNLGVHCEDYAYRHGSMLAAWAAVVDVPDIITKQFGMTCPWNLFKYCATYVFLQDNEHGLGLSIDDIKNMPYVENPTTSEANFVPDPADQVQVLARYEENVLEVGGAKASAKQYNTLRDEIEGGAAWLSKNDEDIFPSLALNFWRLTQPFYAFSSEDALRRPQVMNSLNNNVFTWCGCANLTVMLPPREVILDHSTTIATSFAKAPGNGFSVGNTSADCCHRLVVTPQYEIPLFGDNTEESPFEFQDIIRKAAKSKKAKGSTTIADLDAASQAEFNAPAQIAGQYYPDLLLIDVPNVEAPETEERSAEDTAVAKRKARIAKSKPKTASKIKPSRSRKKKTTG